MIRCAVLSLVLFATPVFAQTRDSRADAEVEAAFQAMRSAASARDIARLRQVVDEGYVMFHGYGPSEPRETWLKLVEAGRLPRQTAETAESNVRIRIFGDTAVRSAIVRFRRADLDQDTWLQGTATLIKRGGAWRVISQQSTLLHEGPIVRSPDLQEYAGSYAIPDRDGFSLTSAKDYLHLKWSNGVEMPLIPLGGDKFVSGYGSTMSFQRSSAGRIEAAVRSGAGGRELFRAKRAGPAR